jgi:hypothetical protein
VKPFKYCELLFGHEGKSGDIVFVGHVMNNTYIFLLRDYVLVVNSVEIGGSKT